jgi:hypothetical protein
VSVRAGEFSRNFAIRNCGRLGSKGGVHIDRSFKTELSSSYSTTNGAKNGAVGGDMTTEERRCPSWLQWWWGWSFERGAIAR